MERGEAGNRRALFFRHTQPVYQPAGAEFDLNQLRSLSVEKASVFSHIASSGDEEVVEDSMRNEQIFQSR